MSASYQTGWDDGYAEGYACKLADATEPFNPQSLDVPDAIEAVADWLGTAHRATFTKPEALGVARRMFRIAKERLS